MLAGRPRDSYVLATKLYFPMSETDRGLSREQVFKQIDASLARLRTDYVDLYQCHRYDWNTPLEETMDALTEVVRSGKARYARLQRVAGRARSRRRSPCRASSRSSRASRSTRLIWRGPETRRDPVQPRARHLADRLVAARAGRPHRQVQARRGDPGGQPRCVRADERLHGQGAATRCCSSGSSGSAPSPDELGLTLAQLALAWVLREPNVASAIIGASRPEQVAENAGAAGVRLDAETLSRIDEILGDSVAWDGPAS